MVVVVVVGIKAHELHDFAQYKSNGLPLMNENVLQNLLAVIEQTKSLSFLQSWDEVT